MIKNKLVSVFQLAQTPKRISCVSLKSITQRISDPAGNLKRELAEAATVRKTPNPNWEVIKRTGIANINKEIVLVNEMLEKVRLLLSKTDTTEHNEADEDSIIKEVNAYILIEPQFAAATNLTEAETKLQNIIRAYGKILETY